MDTHRSKAVCERLGIAASTLRLWSEQFSDHLSPSAQSSVSDKGVPLQRRYTDTDVAVLNRAKILLADGATYEEARDRLTELGPVVAEMLPAVIEPSHPAVREVQQAIEALQVALAAKDDVIRSKDELIAQLRQPAPVVRFRWGFLNRLLVSRDGYGT